MPSGDHGPESEPPVVTELAAEREVVRRMEAQLAAEHGADTPEYWRAMAGRLQDYLAGPRFRLEPGEQPSDDHRRARRWLARVATGYRALAATS